MTNLYTAATSMCRSCTGYCCHQFRIHSLLSGWRDARRDKIKDPWRHAVTSIMSRKGADKKDQRDIRFIAEWFVPKKGRGRVDDYITCRAHDPVAKICTKYSSRPHLCRQYHCIGEAQGSGTMARLLKQQFGPQYRSMKRMGLLKVQESMKCTVDAPGGAEAILCEKGITSKKKEKKCQRK